MSTKKRKSVDLEEQEEDTTRNNIEEQQQATDDDNNTPGGNKSAYNSLLCPITLLLPIDPILAPDGHVYEKEAYAKYLKFPTKNKYGQILSPWTRKPMWNPYSYNNHPYTIRLVISFIDNGIISGEDAKQWKAARSKLQQIQNTTSNSDGEEKYEIGNLYYYGDNEYFPSNNEKAYLYYNMASRCGSIQGEVMAAVCKVYGHGTERDVLYGSHLLVSAAYRGSSMAAYRASRLFCEPEHGIEDRNIELQLLKLAVSESAIYRDISKECLIEANIRLQELQENKSDHNQNDSDDTSVDSSVDIYYAEDV